VTAGRRSAVYAFVDDFVDEGVLPVADRLQDSHFGGVSLATVYHAARDLVPHNSKRAVVHRDEGVHYFPPDESSYRGPLRPVASSGGTAGFEQVTAALGVRSMWWQAWTVYLHNCRLAIAHPQYAVTNAFGDVYVTDLCPSHPDVATYAVDLTHDVARRRPALVVAESLHHAGFGHGYHHERAFVEVSPITAFLLSLCFCVACRDLAGRANVDASDLRARVTQVIRAALDGSTAQADRLDRATLGELCGPGLLDYLAVRESTVTRLTAECASAAHDDNVPFGFIDQTGALKGYVTGEPTGAPAADDAWQLGIDPAAVADACDSYIVLAYAKAAARVAADAAAYRSAIGASAKLRCILRHGRPDSSGVDDLRAKVSAIRAVEADVDFYHYGLMPLAGLDAAAVALETASAGSQV
jgi:hypothetical protein